MPPLIVSDIKLLIVLQLLSGPCKNQSRNFFIYSRPGIELEIRRAQLPTPHGAVKTVRGNTISINVDEVKSSYLVL